MKYSTKTGKLDETRTDCLIVTARTARSVAHALRLDDYFEASSHDFVDKPGRTLLITLPKSAPIRRLLLAGIGDEGRTAARPIFARSSAPSAAY